MPRELFRLAPENQAPYIVGVKCALCDRVSFPSRPICSWCGHIVTTEVAIGRRGKIQYSAVCYNAPVGFTAPYVVGLVEMEEGPIIFCPISDCPPDDSAVPPGTSVELVVSSARAGGQPVIQYRPAMN